MTNSSCKLFNDSKQTVHVRTYNFSDGLHWICYENYQIASGERKTVEAALDDSGLQIKVGDSDTFIAKNGGSYNVSDIVPLEKMEKPRRFPKATSSDGLRYTVVGGDNGSAFRHEAGGVLTRVAVWRLAGGSAARMEFWFADGTSKAIGGDESELSECKTLEFGVGEYVKTLVMWSQCSDHPANETPVLTGIEIETSAGKKLEVVEKNHCAAHVIDVGSGLVVGRRFLAKHAWFVYFRVVY
ncbi:unnamed protein product [Phytophthora fragariaefolia]|uniref:Unnamed protein product n=1 Tax=Phytophthora fragariaefolia TaxID=1490495 RepID=A0A9W6Y6Q2_9STRA|nr:unnamed protein product [Phytophthora fragariaefolia]